MAVINEPTPEPTPRERLIGESDVGDVSQGRLMFRRFKQSKLAVGGGLILIVMYTVALFADFLAPNYYDEVDSDFNNAAPTKIVWDGGLAVCPLKQTLNRQMMEWEYKPNCNQSQPIQWFGKGYDYKLFGFIPTNRHLMTVDEPAKLFLWGADPEGKDVFARTIQGSRISLTIGMVGVINIIFLGSVLGTVSGYFGGLADTVIQRFIEVITSIPSLPLWAAMAAALPQDMGVVRRYFFIAIIVTFITQIGLARQVRGKVMGYASSDYVAATRAAGGSHGRIIFTHLLPNSTSHIVVFAMLLIPATILGETALSFLGIGMLPPAVSWGTLLQDAQRVEVVTAYPWMLIPAAAVILAVTCFQLLGDGVRDAVDPYG